MRRQETARATTCALVLMTAIAAGACANAGTRTIDHWDPGAFRDLDTLQFKTVGKDEGEHWSTVWLVVLDGQVYVRLGSRAAGRMRGNTTAPSVALRIGGREYPRVRAEDAPDMAPRVAAAMADKYWSDVFVRFVPHELTMRLVPEAEPPVR
jgi:hypothetical protein